VRDAELGIFSPFDSLFLLSRNECESAYGGGNIIHIHRRGGKTDEKHLNDVKREVNELTLLSK
jgi:hypothetical protein